MHPESGFQIAPNWPEIEKIAMTSQFSKMTSSSFCVCVCVCVCVSLVEFSYWSKFHINIIKSYDNFFL